MFDVWLWTLRHSRERFRHRTLWVRNSILITSTLSSHRLQITFHWYTVIQDTQLHMTDKVRHLGELAS